MTRETPSGGLVIGFAGEELTLLPDRGLWWPAGGTLFISDPHFGKAAAFRAAAIPIPDATADDLRRLDQLINATRCRTLTILGDLLHSTQGVTPELIQQLSTWRQQQVRLEITLIRGNHDRVLQDLPSKWNFNVVEPPEKIGPFELRHYPEFTGDQPILAGHLHPKFRLRHGSDALSLHCFALRNQTMVLPAFGSFVDGKVLAPGYHKIFAIADQEIIEITPK